METIFLTIPEFLKKYDVADSKIRRRLYRMKNINLEEYQKVVNEVKTYFGYIIQLDENWWARELKAKSRKSDEAEPLSRISKPDKPITEPNLEDKDKEFLKEVVRNQQKQIEDSGKRVDEFLRRYGEINVLLRDLQSKLYLVEGRTENRTQEQKEETEEETEETEVVESPKAESEEIKKE